MTAEHFGILVGIGVGIGLSASCGFRVFVPMLSMSLAAKADMLEMSEGFTWLDTWPAVIGLSVATILEVGAYYIPWLDNLLDTISTPSAAVAGSITAAACFTELDPFLKWSLAIIAGGGSASVISLGTTAARALSSVTTGGAGNPLVSTFELVASLVMSVLSIVAWFLGALFAIIAVGFSLRIAFLFLKRRRSEAEPKAKPV